MVPFRIEKAEGVGRMVVVVVVMSEVEVEVRDCRIVWSRGVKIGSWNVIGGEKGEVCSWEGGWC